MPWHFTWRLSQKAVRFFWSDPRTFLKYISVGAICALIEFSLFSLLYQVAGLPLLTANGIALAVAIVISFTLQKSWTFRAQGAMGRQLRWFIFMQAISALLNSLLIFLFVALLGWYAPVAKLVEIGLVFLWNFTFCKIVVFPARTKPATADARASW